MTASRITPLRKLVVLLGVAVLAAALYAGIVGSAGATTGMTTTRHLSVHKVVRFHRAMDKLWEDHVTWTRMAIVSFVAGSPDLNAAETRLLQNQADIGDAIKPFYGTAKGDKLTSLLRTHILEAVAVLQAAKSGDQTQLAAAQKAWLENADQIALFLHRLNPKNWPLDEMTMMMHDHLKLTTAEAVARLQGDWTGDVKAYDAVHNEILAMSNTIANGIIKQFPGRFVR